MDNPIIDWAEMSDYIYHYMINKMRRKHLKNTHWHLKEKVSVNDISRSGDHVYRAIIKSIDFYLIL